MTNKQAPISGERSPLSVRRRLFNYDPLATQDIADQLRRENQSMSEKERREKDEEKPISLGRPPQRRAIWLAPLGARRNKI
ncbi:hypothetical protein PROFUN_11375 [Planoprotostelium fungivorum]|uniref:Uncharacterized protein n=1 Tax=Planoprotostelium fungivorum TaxID=1890364 RepID=A0A2P6N308_9EUKA|nr:hypothetical protein PROFUN_11375 [Planoprotostelium fungivorum]